MEIQNKKLKAAYSYFISQRDRYLAELEPLLNNYSESNSMDHIYDMFQKIAIVNVTISNIESIISDNQTQGAVLSEYSNKDLDNINHMVELIREGLSKNKEVTGEENKEQ